MGSYFTNSKFVKELSGKDFDSKDVMKVPGLRCGAVLFYANWCPHCKNMKDEWEAYAEMAAFYDVYAFDSAAHTAHSEKIKTSNGDLVSSFPTIIFYKKGKIFKKYTGDRTKAAFMKETLRICG
jgi:thiol-disulfide isomerase/thioredoxin